MMTKLLLTLALFVSTITTAKTLTIDKDRLIKVIGVIDGTMLKHADKIINLSNQNKKPIYLLLNSPGGGVFAGEVFINAMQIAQRRGVEFKCISVVFAASMAFNIFAECDERYAFDNTKLLFHPVRVNTRQALTAPVLMRLAKELRRIDFTLLRKLHKKMEMPIHQLKKAYYDEKLWYAKELKEEVKDGWINIVTDVKGIDKDLFRIQKQRRFSFRYLVDELLKDLEKIKKITQ